MVLSPGTAPPYLSEEILNSTVSTIYVGIQLHESCTPWVVHIAYF